MAPAKVDSLFDRLSSELVDIITEKVRQDCPKSFRALGKTCQSLRDSAQRCAKTLVVKLPFTNRRVTRLSHLWGDSQLFKDLVLTTLSKRPGVTKLVIQYKEFSGEETYAGRHCVVDPLALKPLVGLLWKEIEADGHIRSADYSPFRISWNDEYPKRLVIQSAATLKRLTLTDFDLPQAHTFATLLQLCPHLESLDLAGSWCLTDSLAPNSYIRHEKLTSLDISLNRVQPAGVLLAPSEKTAVPERVIALHLPSLQHLSARNSSYYDLTGASFLAVRSPDFVFPSGLKVLELYRSDFIPWETRGATLYAKLGRDCPQLREIHLVLGYAEAKDLNCETLRRICDQQGLPIECPQLELVSIQRADPSGNEWKTIKTIAEGALVECE